MLDRMKILVKELNVASAAYYSTGKEIMPNKEWDEKYEELKDLEQKSGIILSASPTQRVGYEVAAKLPKEQHKIPALSLDKTKEPEELKNFLGNKEGVLSWKLDGLTVVLTYNHGRLERAVTRGNGMIGEQITDNAKMFANVPLNVPYKGEFIVRGEALITYEDFNRINQELPEGEEPYKNPRNLCSGSVRQLDPGETKRRNVQFIAFAVSFGEERFVPTVMQLFAILKTLGFEVVEHVLVSNGSHIVDWVQTFESKIKELKFPSDGLVLQYNDIAYGKSLGATSKYPRDSIAFKWEDETKETMLRDILWSASRTGLINPVAIFDPVELEGTTVRRASVHNVSIVKSLSLSPGDTISVYKANMIIPQVAENLTRKGQPEIPERCPVCGGRTKVRTLAGDAETLWCENPECPAKRVGAFVHAVGRDALNIEGLSEETLKKLMDVGVLHQLGDLFRLKDSVDVILWMEGFGKKSFENLMNSVEKARHTDLQHLLYALGIDNVGRTASKLICKTFQYDVQKTINATKEELLQIPDIGDIIADSFTSWFRNIEHQEIFEDLLSEVILEKPQQNESPSLTGLTFVITGSLQHFKNREELKQQIEDKGGKVSGSVSSKTSYLINNDSTSTSGKNKKAKELGIPIITEDEFLERF